MPDIVQSLFPGFTGQVIVPQAPDAGLQATSHLHEVAHETAPHAPLPVHETVQAPVPHVMSPHAVASVHVIAQFQPGGHVIAAPPPMMLHVVVATSHDVHSDGHDGAASVAIPTMQ